jgi:hypothetical protein
MVQPITLQIVQSHHLRQDDRALVEIDGSEQDDRIRIWGQRRSQIGFGRGGFGDRGFGRGRGRGLGSGGFGRGRFGQGSATLAYETESRFTAGDYSIRLAAQDELGNQGAWGSAQTYPHRPDPAAPTNLSIASGSKQTWDWSDPA